jgi:hypothetical protein
MMTRQGLLEMVFSVGSAPRLYSEDPRQCMICSVKPVLTKDLCIVQMEDIFNNIAICVKCTLDERPSIFIRDKPIFSSERMLHKGLLMYEFR